MARPDSTLTQVPLISPILTCMTSFAEFGSVKCIEITKNSGPRKIKDSLISQAVLNTLIHWVLFGLKLWTETSIWNCLRRHQQQWWRRRWQGYHITSPRTLVPSELKSRCSLPVITTMALWQLLNLGTGCTVRHTCEFHITDLHVFWFTHTKSR